MVTLLSRLVLPTRTKGPPFVPVSGSTRDKRAQPFYPGWCYQPGQKAPPRDSSKRSYSIQSHVYYLGELVRKPCARQEVLWSNPVVCKNFFNVRHLLSRFCHPRLLSRKPCPGSKTGTKASLAPGQKAKSVVVSNAIVDVALTTDPSCKTKQPWWVIPVVSAEGSCLLVAMVYIIIQAPARRRRCCLELALPAGIIYSKKFKLHLRTIAKIWFSTFNYETG